MDGLEDWIGTKSWEVSGFIYVWGRVQEELALSNVRWLGKKSCGWLSKGKSQSSHYVDVKGCQVGKVITP